MRITYFHELWYLYLMLHIHADGLLLCTIWASIEEIMPVQTLAVPGATLKPLLS